MLWIECTATRHLGFRVTPVGNGIGIVDAVDEVIGVVDDEKEGTENEKVNTSMDPTCPYPRS
jgi:hypothetical protein